MTTLNEVPAGQGLCLAPADQTGASVVWPLRTEEDYLRAVAVVDSLAVKGEENLTATERDRLEIFSTLVEVYENAHCPIELRKVSPIELLRELMDETGMSPSDLGRLLGDRSLGYKVLSGQRKLSKRHLKVLSAHFKLDPGVFIQ